MNLELGLFGLIPIWARIAMGLAGLGLLELAFQPSRPCSVRIAAGVGAGAVFVLEIISLGWHLLAA